MLALLLAPRGRISAARMAAQARLRRQAEARRTAIRLPEAPSSAHAPPTLAGNAADAEE